MSRTFLLNVIICAVISGTIMVVVEMVLVNFFTDHSIWESPRKMAAIMMGKKVLEPHTFDPIIVGVAMLVHFTLSIFYGFVFSFITSKYGSKAMIISGILFGLSLYIINFYVFVSLFPWFYAARAWTMIVAHLAFGFSIGALLDRFITKQED